MSSGAGEGANSSHYKQVETPAGGDKRPYYKERRGGGGYRKDYHPRGGDYHPRAEQTQDGNGEANYNFDAVYTTGSGENGAHYKERRFSRGGYRGGRGGASRGGYRGGERGGYYRGGSRHYDNEGYTVDQQPQIRPHYDSEEEDEQETPENDEEQLTQQQYNFIIDKKAQVKHLIPSALKEEELTKICVDFEFEEEKIDEYLKCLEIDEKYRGIAAFEWQQTQSKE